MKLNQLRVLKIINNVVIGQLEKGIHKVQSSGILHTLEEAKGYQVLDGGTLHIITTYNEMTNI